MAPATNRNSRSLRRVAAFLVSILLSSCGGGAVSQVSPQSAPPPSSPPAVSKLLTWSPPNEFQDNSALVPARDLSGYNIYIKPEYAPFASGDVESASVAPTDTSLDLVPVCRLRGFLSGRYHVSIRSVGVNGILSAFSPSIPFEL